LPAELLDTARDSVKKLSKTFPVIDVRLLDAFELGDFTVLVCEGNIGSLIGRKGTIVSELTKMMGRKVRVIEQTKDEKKMVQDLIGNVRLLGINKVFSPQGTEYKILIHSADESRLPTGKEALEKCIAGLLNGNVAVQFE